MPGKLSRSQSLNLSGESRPPLRRTQSAPALLETAPYGNQAAAEELEAHAGAAEAELLEEASSSAPPVPMPFPMMSLGGFYGGLYGAPSPFGSTAALMSSAPMSSVAPMSSPAPMSSEAPMSSPLSFGLGPSPFGIGSSRFGLGQSPFGSAATPMGAASAPEASARSTGDEWAHTTAEKLRSKRSDNPMLSGAVGAYTGRRDALERLPEEGLPRPKRVIEGVKRMAEGVGFVSGGGLDEVSARDVAGVGMAATRDAIENCTPLEAIRRAPEAASKAAGAAQVASTITPDGRDEVRGAAGDLAKNKAMEGAASVATGTAVATGMRGLATAIPPVGPWAIGAKGLLYGGSFAVQGAGLLHAGYAAQDLADTVDEHRDKSRHTGAAVDDLMARRGAPAPASASPAPTFGPAAPPMPEMPRVSAERPAAPPRGFGGLFGFGRGPAAPATRDMAPPAPAPRMPAPKPAPAPKGSESGSGFDWDPFSGF